MRSTTLPRLTQSNAVISGDLVLETLIDDASSLKDLHQIDWDFHGATTNFATHDFHPYPAKFIPQIPYSLIGIFTKSGEVVYDPFCGCGTSIVEAVRLERLAIGNDISPLAVLITKAKTTFLNEEKRNRIKESVCQIESRIHSLYGRGSLFIQPLPQDPYLMESISQWFQPHVAKELAVIKEHILSIADVDVSDFLNVAFSSIIVSVSLQDSNTRYVRVTKNIQRQDTFKKFSSRVFRMLERVKEIPFQNTRPWLVVNDTRLPTPFSDDCADFAVTSPPYPNAYDYHLYHKHRMRWLDMDPMELKKNEIGSHAHYSKKNGHTHKEFENDMKSCFLQVSRVLKPNKFFCIVIGNSIIRGEKIQNNELLKRIVKETPFEFISEVKRSIQLSKKSFNPAIGKIKTEHIMVFKNNKQ